MVKTPAAKAKRGKSPAKTPPAKQPAATPAVKERKPLYEPRHKVQLPPRKKTTFKRWPDIKLPPLKRKTWDPEMAARIKPPPPKPVVEVPPFKRQPWTPPPPPAAPPKPKIEYPPVTPRTKPQRQRKPKPRPKPVRLEQTFFPLPVPTLGKVWHNFQWRRRCALLHGTLSLSSKKYRRAGGNASAFCLAALCYQQVHPVPAWLPQDVDAIMDVGFRLCKASKPAVSMRPDRISTTAYVGLNKISFNVAKVSEIQVPCVIFGPLTLAVWQNSDDLLVFSPQGTDSDGKISREGTACAMKVPSIEFLTSHFGLCPSESEIYSFQVLKTSIVNPLPDAEPPEPPKLEPLPFPVESIVPVKPEIVDFTFRPHLLKRPAKDQIDFSGHYKLQDSWGILRATKFFTRSFEKLAEATLVVLANVRARRWNVNFFDEVGRVADYEPHNGLKLLQFGTRMFQITAENFVFGQLTTSDPNVADLRRALEEFFSENDSGILFGPQVVALWAEFGHFFYMDPKERDETGQKYVRSDCRDTNRGAACVVFFQDLDDLAELYLASVPAKNKRDLFRLARVKVTPYQIPGEKWHNFESLSLRKWILRASKPSAGDSLCSAIVSLAFLRLKDVSRWKSSLLDDILASGKEMHAVTVLRMKFSGALKSPNLALENLEGVTKFKVQDATFSCKKLDGGLAGHLTFSALQLDLRSFFDFYSVGIFENDSATAVFKVDDVFYIFDPQMRDSQGRNIRAKFDSNETSGLACVLRFLDLTDLCRHIVANALDSLQYRLTPVEVENLDAREKPDLRAFTDFGTFEYAGVLRGAKREVDPDRIYALCLSGLAMTQLIPTLTWTEADLEGLWEIAETATDKSAMLESLRIGRNKFSFSLSKTRCIFEDLEPDEEKETLENLETLNEFEPQDAEEAVEEEETSEEQGQEDEPGVEEENLLLRLTRLEHAIIESPLFTMALWKQGDMYFMFDADETREDGTFASPRLEIALHRSRQQKLQETTDQLREQQTELIDGSEHGIIDLELRKFLVPQKTAAVTTLRDSPRLGRHEGVTGASVLVFTRLEDLHRHLLSLVPEPNRHDHFTWHDLQIQHQLETKAPLAPWNRFSCFREGHWILRGLTSQSDGFSLHGSSQDLAISLVALTFASACNAADWTSDMLDVAVMYGARLYHSSLLKTRESDPALSHITRLELEHLISPFVIDKTKFRAEFELFEDPQSLLGLNATLEAFFQAHDKGILAAKGVAVGIFKDEEACFLFDSHKNGPNGVWKETGTCSLTRFSELDDLVAAFLRNVEVLDGANVFQLHKVNLETENFPTSDNHGMGDGQAEEADS